MDSVSSLNSGLSTTSSERTKDLAICAVLLDEWLKELSAVAQEQLVMMLTELPDNVPAAKGSVLQQVPELRKSGNGQTTM